MATMGPLETAAMEAVAAVEAEAAAAESSQAESNNHNNNNNKNSKEEAAPTNQSSYKTLSKTQCLALIPLRPAPKKKTLEVKQLPIVLGRTNLAQWWYQVRMMME